METYMRATDEINGSHEQLVVAICTYRRPRLLSTLLTRISVIEGRDRVIVLVVDNDPDQSAERVVQDVNDQPGAGVVYLHATPQGLATARNVALDFGGERSLPVLFIDDDELPEPTWLITMLSSHKRFPHAIVAGPVRPEFAGALPNWAPDSSFWLRSEYPDNEALRVPTGTGNTLFPTKVTVGGLRFDTDFDLMGGEDTHFMLRWLRAKEQIVWSARAIAVEHVPVERLSLRYARDRNYSASMAYQRAIQKVRGRRQAFDALRISRRWGLAAILWVYGTATSSAPTLARAQFNAAAARGTWAGMKGQWVNRRAEYQVDL
jgi:succinoglycan biosynthesis protein ExoM